MRVRIDCKKGGVSQIFFYEWLSKFNLILKFGKFIKKLDVICERLFYEECVEFCVLDLGCVVDYI